MQWLWLLLPLVMILVTVALLVGTIWQSRGSNVLCWRNSALATMAHGVNTSTSNGNDNMDTSGVKTAALAISTGKETVSELETWAEDVTVRLQRRGPPGKDYGLIII